MSDTLAEALRLTMTHDPAGVPVLHVRGEVDLTTADQLRERLLAACARHPRLVLDLSGAMFFDASGLRALSAVHRDATRRQASPPVLRGVRPLLAKMLRHTGMAAVFTVEPGPAPVPARAGTPPRAQGLSAPGARQSAGGPAHLPRLAFSQ